MVKDGYKETEIGIIPEDWKVAILGDKVKYIGEVHQDRSRGTSLLPTKVLIG